MSIHLYSPFVYILYVKLICFIPTYQDSIVMKFIRKTHNIILSFSSLIMLVGITYGTYDAGKFKSLNNLLCLPYDNDSVAYNSALIFLYSKYIEWGDTLFLHLSGKHISMLQYTHHMTTAFLMYNNMIDYLSPHMFVFMGLNCFVHIPMYWYFSYPKGFLHSVRKMITQIQIFQHIICLATIIYTMNLDNCQQNKYGNQYGLIMYLMYLFYFSLFYVKSYRKK